MNSSPMAEQVSVLTMATTVPLVPDFTSPTSLRSRIASTHDISRMAERNAESSSGEGPESTSQSSLEFGFNPRSPLYLGKRSISPDLAAAPSNHTALERSASGRSVAASLVLDNPKYPKPVHRKATAAAAAARIANPHNIQVRGGSSTSQLTRQPSASSQTGVATLAPIRKQHRIVRLPPIVRVRPMDE